MLNPHLLQLIRLEAATFGPQANGLPCLTSLHTEEVLQHVERLYFGGELAGRSFIEGNNLHIRIDGLTPFGLMELHAFRARHPDTAAKDEPPN